MSVNRILCPIDHSEASEQVFDYVVKLAAHLDAVITLLHAHHTQESMFQEAGWQIGSGFDSQLRADAERSLKRLARRHPTRVETAIVTGQPYKRIVEYAKESNADLIVMGTRTGTGLRHLAGSVAERVLRTSEVPVLTLPLRAGDPAEFALDSLLVPYDFSELSLAGLQLARTMVDPLHAKLTLLHVLDEDVWYARWLDDIQREHYKSALSRELDADLVEMFGKGKEANALLRAGNVTDTVLNVAEEVGANMIVLGASGKSGVERFLLGSVTIELVRRSRVPVLTVT